MTIEDSLMFGRLSTKAWEVTMVHFSESGRTTKKRPPGKTGRDDSMRDTERVQQKEEGTEEWHERGDDRGERGETGEEGSAHR
jgi:hypothetical protein